MSASADVAVEITRTMLQQDGYDVRLVGFEAGELELAIIAGPNACEECLVPKDVLASIISANLPEEFAGTKITLTYPAEAH